MKQSATIVVHPTNRYDFSEAAKSGIEKLATNSHAESIFVINHPDDTMQNYYLHAPNEWLSKDGTLMDTMLDQVRDFSHFILAGGSFGQCHLRTLKSLASTCGPKEIEIPLEAVYIPIMIPKKESVLYGYSFNGITIQPETLYKWIRGRTSKGSDIEYITLNVKELIQEAGDAVINKMFTDIYSPLIKKSAIEERGGFYCVTTVIKNSHTARTGKHKRRNK